jgi:lauroyl/myristoyl acyltransferase
MRLDKNKALSIVISRVLNVLVDLLGLIPIRVGQALGRMLGRFLGIAAVGPMKSSLNGLRLVFGDHMSEKELRKLNRKIVIHFAQMLFEVPHVLRLNSKASIDTSFLKMKRHLKMRWPKRKGVSSSQGISATGNS